MCRTWASASARVRRPICSGSIPPIVVGVADVELAGRVLGGQVRAVGLVGGHAGAVEAGGRRHRVGELSGQAQAEAPAHAVAEVPCPSTRTTKPRAPRPGSPRCFRTSVRSCDTRPHGAAATGGHRRRGDDHRLAQAAVASGRRPQAVAVRHGPQPADGGAPPNRAPGHARRASRRNARCGGRKRRPRSHRRADAAPPRRPRRAAARQLARPHPGPGGQGGRHQPGRLSRPPVPRTAPLRAGALAPTGGVNGPHTVGMEST